MEAIYLSISG